MNRINHKTAKCPGPRRKERDLRRPKIR